MKFFSNEKENDTQQIPDREDRAASEPVTVPPQRAGSPWSDAPRDSSDPSDSSASSADDSRESGPRNTDSQDSSSSRETGPWNTDSQETSSGDTSFRDASVRDASDDRATTTTTYGPDGSVVESPADRDDDRPGDDTVSGDDPDRTTAINSGGEHVDADKDKPSEDAAVKDDGSFDSPKAVDPATDEPLKDEETRADGYRDGEEFQPSSETAPVVAAVAVPAAAAASGAHHAAAGSGSGERLLPDGDSYAERFRDIQLRFVDEPKEATAEAATLVGEAVDKLTSALKAQRDGLAGNSDDTEKLRVELRAYRDILNRLLAL
ncbi:hypothetical protein [Actinoplanes solisilvae]|uniref:hypothetical protein n=1 Tax=Actinoplanes solisilvae TaxID=2486853 RepID=UPI000FD8319D|nr:hypothetical protein [Actinoplanes solisilvae]